MYQCSKKERQTYPIRPHHGMCLAFFIGNGYSTGFTAHMQEMLELFTKGADVCLTVKTDEICSACPNNSQGICEAAEKVKRYDNAVLAECGLKEGQKLAFPEFTEAVQKKIIETGKRTKICGDCFFGTFTVAFGLVFLNAFLPMFFNVSRLDLMVMEVSFLQP